jgi:hypothetical protein
MPREGGTTAYQLRMKAATMVVTGGILATMLMYDWGGVQGQDNVFSGIRPTVRRMLSVFYESDSDSLPVKREPPPRLP